MVNIRISKNTMVGVRLLNEMSPMYGNGTLSGVVSSLVHKQIMKDGLAIYCNNGYFGVGSIVEEKTADNTHRIYVIVEIDKSSETALIRDIVSNESYKINTAGGFAWRLTGLFNEDGTIMKYKDVIDGK